MERGALGFPTTRSSTLNGSENLSKQPAPPLSSPSMSTASSSRRSLAFFLTFSAALSSAGRCDAGLSYPCAYYLREVALTYAFILWQRGLQIA